MTQLVTVLIGGGFAAMIVFIGLYLRSPSWWRSAMGRNLMAMPAVLGGLLGLWLLGRLVYLPVWLWAGGIASLDAVMWWRVAILWRLQRREK